MNDPDTYCPEDEWQETAPPLRPTRVVRGRRSVGFRSGYDELFYPPDLSDIKCNYCGRAVHDRSNGGDCSEDVKQVVRDIRKPLTYP